MGLIGIVGLGIANPTVGGSWDDWIIVGRIVGRVRLDSPIVGCDTASDLLSFLVRPLGFEPRTCGLRVSDSAVRTIRHRPLTCCFVHGDVHRVIPRPPRCGEIVGAILGRSPGPRAWHELSLTLTPYSGWAGRTSVGLSFPGVALRSETAACPHERYCPRPPPSAGRRATNR